jgi:hypothetical protein
MTYRIFKRENGFWFQLNTNSALRVNHGPYETKAEAKVAADAYVKDW